MSSTEDLKNPYNPHDASVKEDTSLRILNSSEGVRNYIPKNDFFDMMYKVFSEISSNLANHCGPYSRSALVVSPSGGKYETNTFTKDGRNIVSSMNFVSPIEEIIKEMLLYIGSKVDNKAGDGTTSSMYLTSDFFSQMSKHYKDEVVNSRQFALEYKKFEEILFKYLNNQKVTLEDVVNEIYPNKDEELSIDKYQAIVAAIAAFQTLASSGGDMELAKCMHDIYLQSPPGTWDYIATYHKKYETSARYAVEYDAYDHWINAIILTPTMLNENLYSEYKNDKCDLMIIPEKIPGGGVLFDQINGYLSVNMQDRRDNDLVIVCRDMDPVVLTKINNYNTSDKKTHNIVVFDHQDDLSITAVSMSLIALSLCGGKDPYITSKNMMGMLNEHFVLHDVALHYKNHKLYVNNLFDKDDSNDTIHPFYKDPNRFKPFTMFLNMLQRRVKEIKDDINQSQYSKELELLQNTISKMCFPRRPYLMIGGKAHDHAEAIDVVRDCAGAINSSLTDGFICGSSLALLRALIKSNSNLDNVNEINEITNMCINSTINLIGITLFGRPIDNVEYNNLSHLYSWYCNYINYGTNTDDDAEFSYEEFEKFRTYFVENESHKFDYINILEKNKNDAEFKFGIYPVENYINGIKSIIENHDYFDCNYRNDYAIVQPAKVFEQLFERIGELMIKLITTECVIVPGAVYVTEKKDNELKVGIE